MTGFLYGVDFNAHRKLKAARPSARPRARTHKPTRAEWIRGLMGKTVQATLSSGPKYRDQAEAVEVCGVLHGDIVRVRVVGEESLRRVHVERLDGCPK